MKFFLLLIILLINQSHAYVPAKCGGLFREKGFYGLFEFSITSTSQFVSSSGECSALGLIRDHEDRVFYVVNRSSVETDIAKGSGEYLQTLKAYWTCESESLETIQYLRSNFEIFSKLNNEESFNLLKFTLCNDAMRLEV